jgi:hypothetical protein
LRTRDEFRDIGHAYGARRLLLRAEEVLPVTEDDVPRIEDLQDGFGIALNLREGRRAYDRDVDAFPVIAFEPRRKAERRIARRILLVGAEGHGSAGLQEVDQKRERLTFPVAGRPARWALQILEKLPAVQFDSECVGSRCSRAGRIHCCPPDSSE